VSLRVFENGFERFGCLGQFTNEVRIWCISWATGLHVKVRADGTRYAQSRRRCWRKASRFVLVLIDASTPALCSGRIGEAGARSDEMDSVFPPRHGRQ